ncbi:MAG: phage baseplate assembly protein V [Selenomonadaceae bacterium]|nr:phage baseplate assembly protein V [Selenomonadaceae bacterium]
MKNLIRFGKVSAVIPERCACRVVFDDRDNLVSAELPVLQSSCLNNRFYNLPDVGDSVLCLMAPNDEHGAGFVLGSFFTEKNPAPAQSQEISMIKFGDGTTIQYDRESHELQINCVGNIRINGKNIYLNGD